MLDSSWNLSEAFWSNQFLNSWWIILSPGINSPLLTSVCFPSSPEICSVSLRSIFLCWILKFLSFEGGSSFVEWISFLIATLDRSSGCVRLCSCSSATVSLFNLTGTCSTVLFEMHYRYFSQGLVNRTGRTVTSSYRTNNYLGRKFLSIWGIYICHLFCILADPIPGRVQPPEIFDICWWKIYDQKRTYSLVYLLEENLSHWYQQ